LDSAEQRPPVGTDLVLNAGQLRYCFSESIRLDAAKDVVTADADIDRFNLMVEDYNTRCGQFRYRRTVFDAIQAQVQANKTLLEFEGLARFRR
jgi:hypothetical protein